MKTLHLVNLRINTQCLECGHICGGIYNHIFTVSKLMWSIHSDYRLPINGEQVIRCVDLLKEIKSIHEC